MAENTNYIIKKVDNWQNNNIFLQKISVFETKFRQENVFNFNTHYAQVRNIILDKITKVKPTLNKIYGKKCRKMQKKTYFRK